MSALPSLGEGSSDLRLAALDAAGLGSSEGKLEAASRSQGTTAREWSQ